MPQPDKDVNTCEFCRYSLPVPTKDGELLRICRAHPPTPVFNPQAASTDTYTPSKWPVVENAWWCGEYKNQGN